MDERPWHRFYDPGVHSSLEFRDLTIPDLLDEASGHSGDATAVAFMNARLTYRELQDEVERFATALAQLGAGRDTRVAIQLPNLPQTVIAYFATLSLGAQVVMTNPLYVEREIEHQWNDAGCSIAVLPDFLYANRVRAIRDRLPIQHYVIASIPEYLGFPLNLLAPFKLRKATPPLYAKVEPAPGVHRMRELIRATPPAPPRPPISMDDVAVVQYTGGTTGVSKGAMLTHRNLSFNVQQMKAWFPQLERGTEVFLASLPFFHVFGLTVAMNFPTWLGAAMVLIPNPRDVRAMMTAITKHRVTVFPGVPAMYNAINNLAAGGRVDLTSVKACVSGSAPLPRDVQERFERLTNGRIAEGFGLTETSPVTHCNPLLGQRKTGSIGIPLPDTDAAIVDLDSGENRVPPGTDGELVIRGPQVMKGYWNRTDETAAMIRDGWLHTGDIARMDEEGYFYIVGRKKEMILVSGYNVYPDEVDAVLIAHPAVLESATIGVPDAKRGESVKSFVVLKPGASATEQELIEHAKRELAPYKVPRQLEFRMELPRSAALKVLRRELRDEHLKRTAQPSRSH
ncbi:MAG: long-chain-fatty-acid--CoA ligase [Longimicrobiales bacterium]